MQNQNETNGFQYTYSAKEQAEVKRIREKYAPAPKEENKMERLRRLDAGVTQKAQAVSLVFGVIGTLILGFGMSLCMTDIGAFLGGKEWAMALGIAIGVVGGTLAGFAFPMYQRVLRREKQRVAPEILRLTEELIK